MSRQWKWFLAAVLAGMLLPAAPRADLGPTEPADDGPAAHILASTLTSVRVEQDAGGMPVITLASDDRLEFESFMLDGPDRLVIDLPDTISDLQSYRLPVEQGGVLQVRAGQHQLRPNPVTRVVFDLDRAVSHWIERTPSGLAVHFGAEAQANAVQPAGSRPESVVQPLPGSEATTPSLGELLADMESRAPAESADGDAVAEQVGDSTPAIYASGDLISNERAVPADEIDRLLRNPQFAAPAEAAPQSRGGAFETKMIGSEGSGYSGKRISLNLVDADIKQVFRLFHEISGLNFVLDPEVSGRVTIVLDQVPWDQALDLILKNNGLDKVLEGNVLRIASTRKLAQEAAARKQLKEAEQLEVEPITITRTLSYAKAEDVQSVIREGGVLSARGRVIVDERTNTLIMSDVPDKVMPLDTLISTLDAETPQVMIEARIVETSRNFSQDLGVVWGVEAIADASRGTATQLGFPHNMSARYGLNLPGQQASVLGFSFGNVVDSFTLDLELNALETEGEGRILSSPKIATQNNERAEIEQGVRIPIVNTTATEINVEFVSASLKMSVTPQITAENTVILDIVVENNSPDFVNTAGGIPSIRTQRAQTKVLINDGGTTVIGGIFVVNEGTSEIGVPWFRKLPVFGWLFKSHNITEENRELLIFITPKIIKLT